MLMGLILPRLLMEVLARRLMEYNLLTTSGHSFPAHGLKKVLFSVRLDS